MKTILFASLVAALLAYDGCGEKSRGDQRSQLLTPVRQHRARERPERVLPLSDPRYLYKLGEDGSCEDGGVPAQLPTHVLKAVDPDELVQGHEADAE